MEILLSPTALVIYFAVVYAVLEYLVGKASDKEPQTNRAVENT